MKNFFCFVFIGVLMAGRAQPCQFSVNPSPGPYSITCTNTMVILSTGPSSLSYVWTSVTNPPVNGTVATFTSTGIYTVSASGTACATSSQTFSIVNYTTAPSNSASPSSQVTNCSNTTAVTFSGTISDPTVNISSSWYGPVNPPPGGPPLATSGNTTILLQGNIAPGVYTLITTNQVNGCSTQKTVTLTSSQSYPTFSMYSPTNFSLGCIPLNQTTLNIVNAVSTNTPPGTVSFTFLPPGFNGSVTSFGVNNNTVVNIPGSWTVIVQDNSNFCRTEVVVPVVQNTTAPHVAATMMTQTLTCKTPTILATGSSSTSNTSIEWLLPVPLPNNLPTSTLVIGTASTGPQTSSTSLSYASFTVISTNTLTACKNSSVIVIDQNFKPPVSDPKISVATPTAIYCIVATNPVILTTGNSTVTSGIQNAFASPALWAGPPPQGTLSGTSTYSAFVPGTYTLVIMDSENGCTKSNTVEVIDKRDPPVITNPAATSTFACASNSASLLFALSGPSTGVSYQITSYPPNTAFSPSAVIDQAGTSSTTVSVSKLGTYVYKVTYTLTGCTATGTYVVVPGDINAMFEPNPAKGYAPLDVLFFNNTSSSSGISGINSIWSFGNGNMATTNVLSAVRTTYQAAGDYTVSLVVQKGSCIDTVQKVVKVDLASDIEVPNAFSPNGDGINDEFFVKAASLSSIYAIIADRWGNKVYEVSSSTGNIAWDGKNLQGQACAQGVYFYIITAEGKDFESFTRKGHVSLFR